MMIYAMAVMAMNGAAAATTPEPPAAPPPPVIHLPPPVYHDPLATQGMHEKIGGAPLYIYSFLDVREENYTPKVLAQLDGDLTAFFNGELVKTRILRFRSSPLGENYSASIGVGQDSTMIPVGPVIEQNLADEAAFGARYRLVIFPASYSSVGAWRYYDIRWILSDARTNARLWTHMYSGRHLVMWSDKENAAARSKKIIDDLERAMRDEAIL